jgi:hypothetical protein
MCRLLGRATRTSTALWRMLCAMALRMFRTIWMVEDPAGRRAMHVKMSGRFRRLYECRCAYTVGAHCPVGNARQITLCTETFRPISYIGIRVRWREF